MAKKITRYQVTHPDYGECTISSETPEGATVAAALLWDVKWAKLVALCDVTPLPDPQKPKTKRCPTCGHEVLMSAKLCGVCAAKRRQSMKSYLRHYPEKRNQRTGG